MVLLNDIVEIFHLQDVDQPAPSIHSQQAIHVEQPHRVRSAFVDDDLFRPAVIADGFSEERGRCYFIATLSEYEIMGIAQLIDRPIKICPLP
jgi:hypothetical protein